VAGYQTYRMRSTVLRVAALAVLVIGITAGGLAYLWFAHRRVNVSDPEMMMRIVIGGEPRLGERVGGLLALGSVFVASVLFWCAHVMSSRSATMRRKTSTD
jgi:hypothetical protein